MPKARGYSLSEIPGLICHRVLQHRRLLFAGNVDSDMSRSNKYSMEHPLHSSATSTTFSRRENNGIGILHYRHITWIRDQAERICDIAPQFTGGQDGRAPDSPRAVQKIEGRRNSATLVGVRDEIRTHTAFRPLPPQSSVSTNFTTRTNFYRRNAD